METTDFALLDRWRSEHDAEAFAELVRRHASMVFATCKRLLRNVSDAEEVSQECFAFLAQEPRRPQHHLGGWLHRVATTRSLDRLKADSRRRSRDRAFGEQQEHQQTSQIDDLLDLVDEVIAELPDKYRAPLVAHFLEQQTHQAVSEAMSVPRPTVSLRIRKGLELIRKGLRRRGVDMGVVALTAWLRTQTAEAATSTAGSGSREDRYGGSDGDVCGGRRRNADS